jgi:hypothetical protein
MDKKGIRRDISAVSNIYGKTFVEYISNVNDESQPSK